MKSWTLLVTVSVADSWVADGFNMKERKEEVAEKISTILPFAYGHEVRVRVAIKDAPSARIIKGLQNGGIEPKD